MASKQLDFRDIFFEDSNIQLYDIDTFEIKVSILYKNRTPDVHPISRTIGEAKGASVGALGWGGGDHIYKLKLNNKIPGLLYKAGLADEDSYKMYTKTYSHTPRGGRTYNLIYDVHEFTLTDHANNLIHTYAFEPVGMRIMGGTIGAGTPPVITGRQVMSKPFNIAVVFQRPQILSPTGGKGGVTSYAKGQSWNLLASILRAIVPPKESAQLQFLKSITTLSRGNAADMTTGGRGGPGSAISNVLANPNIYGQIAQYGAPIKSTNIAGIRKGVTNFPNTRGELEDKSTFGYLLPKNPKRSATPSFYGTPNNNYGGMSVMSNSNDENMNNRNLYGSNFNNNGNIPNIGGPGDPMFAGIQQSLQQVQSTGTRRRTRAQRNATNSNNSNRNSSSNSNSNNNRNTRRVRGRVTAANNSRVARNRRAEERARRKEENGI